MAGREALAKAYEDAKDRLGLTQTDIVAMGGPSTTSQSKIGRGRYVSPGSLSKLDKALGWERGRSARIIAGTPAATQAGPLTGYSDTDLLKEVARRIREGGSNAQSAPTQKMTGGDSAARPVVVERAVATEQAVSPPTPPPAPGTVQRGRRADGR